MLYWIFDLDQTLYQLPCNVDFNYKLLKKNENLKYLLDELPSTKVIFTNGTYNHAKICLNKIDIENNFKSIISRDKILTLKPEHNSYLRCMNLNNITNNDKCVFFDDLPDNLINAKSFGWITVLIKIGRAHV